MCTENARVVILGKKTGASLSQFSRFRVPEKEIADRTVKEFSTLSSGLLQAIVLRGLAHIRENNLRVLTRFHPGLDVGFLTHRALLLPNDVFNQVVPLLADEMRAILEDKLGDAPLGPASHVKKIVSGWHDERWEEDDTAKAFVGDKVKPARFAKHGILTGYGLKKKYCSSKEPHTPAEAFLKKVEEGGRDPKWPAATGKHFRAFMKLMCGKNGGASHDGISILMSQRAKYGDASRELHLGVIIREMAEDRRYLLCLQPVCDSVRISGSQTFVFCVMAESKEGAKTTHVIHDPSEGIVSLLYRPEATSCVATQFAASKGGSVTAKKKNGGFFFKDVAAKKYQWISELKTEHAQRAAEDFGRDLSRVGLTESEWLRLRAK